MKTFLITGATSSIGEACARHCLAQGDQVVALCRNGDKAHRLFAPELASGQMVLLEHDLACNDGLYKQCLSELKPFKIERFIHCAGVGLIKGMASTTHAELLQLYETHLFALSEIMRALVRLCQFKYELSAVALSSVASPAYLVQNAAYGLSKDSVDHYVRLLNKQLNAAPQKRLPPPVQALAVAEAIEDPEQRARAVAIAQAQAGLMLRINALAPGMVDTPLGDCDTYLEQELPLNVIPMEVIVHWIFEILETPYMSGQTVVLNNDWVY